MYICNNCNKKIDKKQIIYFAFDSKCCSTYCRNLMIYENCKIDYDMLYPQQWIANKDITVDFLETTPKYNNSLNNIKKMKNIKNLLLNNEYVKYR